MLYLRKEPTTDELTRRQPARPSPAQRDVVAYRTRAGAERGEACVRWPWFYESKPDRRRKYVTLNCARHSVVWLEDMAP